MSNPQKKKPTLDELQTQINSYYQFFSSQHYKKTSKLRYNPSTILQSLSSLLKSLILYLTLIKFPLLISLYNKTECLTECDQKIKRLYQSLINQHKLVNEFQFEYFIFITVKTTASFIEHHFPAIEVTNQDEKEMYCGVIKILLGLHVHQKGFTILEKKFIDLEKYEPCPVIEANSKRPGEKPAKNEKKDSKRQISINFIQAKLQRRKQNRFKNSQISSFHTWRNSHEIDQFKENLMKELKVIDQSEKKLIKIKYAVLENKNIHELHQEKQEKYLFNNRSLKKKVIHTQQISASLELSLLMKQCNYSYTKSNIAIRLTDSTPRLSHRVFQISPPHRNISPRESVTILNEKPILLNKKTKTYWSKMANKMREINNSFQY